MLYDFFLCNIHNFWYIFVIIIFVVFFVEINNSKKNKKKSFWLYFIYLIMLSIISISINNDKLYFLPLYLLLFLININLLIGFKLYN